MDGVILLMLLAVPAVVALGIWYQRHRVGLARKFAESAGWEYVGSDPGLVSRWYGTPFAVGRSRRTSEVVRGRFQGRPATSFGYRYTTGSGKNQSTYTFHVVAIDLPAYLPTLELTPDGLGAKIAKGLGGQDIQLESEAFNARWRVEARDQKFAHDVVHPRLMELLNAGPPDPVRIEGTDIWTWHTGVLQTEPLHARLTRLAAIVDSVPRHVWQDHGADPVGGAHPEGAW